MELDEYDVIVSEDALSMLDKHARFLANVSISEAQNFINQTLSDIESLKTLPERCPFYENQFIPSNRYRMLLSGKRYLILYEVSINCVYIDYIIDCRQDYTKR